MRALQYLLWWLNRLAVGCNHSLFISDTLQSTVLTYGNASFQRTEIISSFEQIFSADDRPKDVLHDQSHWNLSFPHETSGPCHTYNPLYVSDAGLHVGMYIVMKDAHWDPALEIFLHPEHRLYYTYKPYWHFLLEPKTLEEIGLYHPRLEGNVVFLRYAVTTVKMYK